MGLFSGVKLSGVALGGGKAMDFKGEGDFVLEITEVKGGQTRKKQAYFEVFHKVVESTNPAQPVGSTVNLFCMLDDDLGLQNMKTILAVMSGLNPNTAADIEAINKMTDEEWITLAETGCADQRLFVGRKVNCSVVSTPVKTVKTRTHYLRRRYTPHAETVAPLQAANAPAKGKK